MCVNNFTIAFAFESKLTGGNDRTREIIVATSDDICQTRSAMLAQAHFSCREAHTWSRKDSVSSISAGMCPVRSLQHIRCSYPARSQDKARAAAYPNIVEFNAAYVVADAAACSCLNGLAHHPAQERTVGIQVFFETEAMQF